MASVHLRIGLREFVDWLALIGSENKQGNIGVEEANDLYKRLSLKHLEEKIKFAFFGE